MIDRIRIDNFRGIHRLEIKGLRPLTVFTGDNGCGKSTVLEAMLLWHAEGNPGPLFSLQSSRGYMPVMVLFGAQGIRGFTTAPADMEPLTRSLFHGFSDTGSATIAGAHGDKPYESLKIVKEEPSGLPPEAMLGHADPTSVRLRPQGVVRFIWGRKRKSAITWDYKADPPGPKIENGEGPKYHGMLMFPIQVPAGWEESSRFGELKLAGRAEAVAQPLSQFDQRITGVDWISAHGGFFAAQMGKRYVPFGALGGGINRLFSMLINMDWCRNGFLGVDEVENGFHYSKLPGVFRALVEGRKANKAQLALATHSHEALDALVRAAYDLSPDDLAVVHMRRDEQDTVRAHVYGGRDAIASVDLGYELR
jgi:hypothetical protein